MFSLCQTLDSLVIVLCLLCSRKDDSTGFDMYRSVLVMPDIRQLGDRFRFAVCQGVQVCAEFMVVFMPTFLYFYDPVILFVSV